MTIKGIQALTEMLKYYDEDELEDIDIGVSDIHRYMIDKTNYENELLEEYEDRQMYGAYQQDLIDMYRYER